MTEKIIGLLAHFIIAVISATGYLGIALLMGIESACIPLPSEIIMPFSGYLVYTGRFQLFWVATAGAIGCNLGSAVAYWIGAHGGRPLVERFGSYVLLSRRDLDRTTNFFLKYGSITVFLARLLPVVRTFIALPAGIARMPLWRFHIYTLPGLVAMVFCAGVCGHEAGPLVGNRSPLQGGLSPLPSRRRGRAAGGHYLVRLVALEATHASRHLAFFL